MKIHTIAEVKVSYIAERTNEIDTIRQSSDSADVLFNFWDKDLIGYQEQFKILLLNRAGRVLGVKNISTGGAAGTVVDAKLIFQAALLCNASSIILAHNHPSGSLVPSIADKEITKKMCKGGKVLDICVLDHIILNPHGGYYSFADEGLID